MKTKPVTYAIDFGTSNSLLAGAGNTETFSPVPLDPFAEDPTVLRSTMFVTNKSWTYGAKAITSYSENTSAGRFFRSIKKYLPQESFHGTEIDGVKFTLSDLVAKFLRHMRDQANAFYDTEVDNVVLGRPALFSQNTGEDKLAEDRLKVAAEAAGFKNIAFCPEPIAASHTFRKELDTEKIVFIADFGGGTSDFTVMKMSKRAFSADDVLAIGGISVAGDAFDGSIMRGNLLDDFGQGIRYQPPMSKSPLKLPRHLFLKLCSPPDILFLNNSDTLGLIERAHEYLYDADRSQHLDQLRCLIEEGLGFDIFQAIENAKKDLTTSNEVELLYRKYVIAIQKFIDAMAFANAAQSLTDKIMKTIKEVVHQSQIDLNKIDIICCTGGTAQIPALKQALGDMFGHEKLTAHQHFHSVIQGLAEAAIQPNG